MEEQNNFKPESNESIKLMKMSKGYQWEIKILPIPVHDLSDVDGRPTGRMISRLGSMDIDRLVGIDKELQEKLNFSVGTQ
jgi:hypothetical protein